MRAKKHLGQHFLTSNQAVSEMITAAQVILGDTILEIGPGRGVLTRALLDTGANVIAIEKDTELLPVLRNTFRKELHTGQLRILEGDATEPAIIEQLSGLEFQNHTYKLVANIPYYITGLILRTYISGTFSPISATLLVQKEVAEQIITKQGRESILSLAIKIYGTPSIVSIVTADHFSPPPKVDSAILHIADIHHEHFTEMTENEFFRVVRAGFASRRQTLANNLKRVLHLSHTTEILQSIGLHELARAETLNISEWLQLVRILRNSEIKK